MGKGGLGALWALPILGVWLACSSTSTEEQLAPCATLDRCTIHCSCPAGTDCVQHGYFGHCAKPCAADTQCGADLCSLGHCVAACGVNTTKNDCEGNPYNGSHSYPCNSTICFPDEKSDCSAENVAREGVVYYQCSYSNPPSSTSSSSSSTSSSGSTCNYSKCVEACNQAGGTNCGQDCKCP